MTEPNESEEPKIDPGLLRRSLKELLPEGVNPRLYEVILVGDGSGTNWQRACGWACVVFRQVKPGQFRISVRRGFFSEGSNIVAEIMCYVQAMLWLLFRFRSDYPNGANVLVISDCEYVVKAGHDQKQRGKYRPLFGLFSIMERDGFAFKWMHRRRETSLANSLVDYVSGYTRVEGAKSQALVGDQKIRPIPTRLRPRQASGNGVSGSPEDLKGIQTPDQKTEGQEAPTAKA